MLALSRLPEKTGLETRPRMCVCVSPCVLCGTTVSGRPDLRTLRGKATTGALSYAFVFAHPVRYLRTFHISSFSVPRRNSDPGLQSRRFSPLPTTVRAFLFIARRVQRSLPSPTPANCAYPRYKELSAVGVSRNRNLLIEIRTPDSNLGITRG